MISMGLIPTNSGFNLPLLSKAPRSFPRATLGKSLSFVASVAAESNCVCARSRTTLAARLRPVSEKTLFTRRASKSPTELLDSPATLLIGCVILSSRTVPCAASAALLTALFATILSTSRSSKPTLFKSSALAPSSIIRRIADN